MSEETIAVETLGENAAAQPEEVTTQTVTEVDYEVILAQKDAEIAKIRDEKDNYRKGLLKAKGHLPEEDDNFSNDEDIDSKVSRLVQEQLLKTKEAQALAEKDTLISAMAKKNKELSLALKNRGQVTNPSGQGSNQEMPESPKDHILSNDQINALKGKGWDDGKIEEFKKNLAKVNQMPK